MPNEIESYTPFYKGKPLYGLGGGGGGSSTDENVLQSPSNSNSDFEVLLSGTADNTEHTEGTKKNTSIKHNPSTGNTTITGNYSDVNGKLAHKPLTQDQYNALTQAQQLDGTEYFVRDRVPLQICDYIYPIGSIYMSVTNVSPAILFGGTWERIEDKFLLAAGSTYNAGATGGEAEHTLIVDEIPAHKHVLVRQQWYSSDRVYSSGTGSIYSWKSGTGGTTSASYRNNADGNDFLDSGGGNQPHNNMPPYLVVNVWMRVPDPVEEEEEE